MFSRMKPSSSTVLLCTAMAFLLATEQARAQCKASHGKQPRNPFLPGSPGLQMPLNPVQKNTALLTALRRQQQQITLLTTLQQRQLTVLQTALPQQNNKPTPLQQRSLTILVQRQSALLTALQNQSTLLNMLQLNSALLTPLQQQQMMPLLRQQTTLQNLVQQQNDAATQLLGIAAPSRSSGAGKLAVAEQ
jgi:hypothetical protein